MLYHPLSGDAVPDGLTASLFLLLYSCLEKSVQFLFGSLCRCFNICSICNNILEHFFYNMLVYKQTCLQVRTMFKSDSCSARNLRCDNLLRMLELLNRFVALICIQLLDSSY